MAIQHAADALWPYTEDDNRPIRKRFKLPLERPFTGNPLRIRPMKSVRLILAILVALVGTSVQIFALATGDRVQANAAASIRDNPAGNLIDNAVTGDAGNIIAGPVTATFQGTSYVWWRVDWDTRLTGWSIEPRLTKVTPAPVINSVSPSSVVGVPLPGRVSLTLNGSNFVNSPTVAVTWTGGAANIASQYVTFVSSTRVDITVATDVTADTWTVKVTNPDGQQSNTRNFTVTAPPRSRTGVDYSFSHPSPSGLKAAGYNFAIRYVGGSGSPHDITATEAQALQNAGVDIIVVFESTTGRMLSGYTAGVADANTAVAIAIAAGGPTDFFCYFACDFDASLANQPAINAYLDGAATVLGGVQRVGFYGGYWPLKRVLDAGKAAKGWQTAAWSNGNRDSRISLYQRPGEVAIAGGTCDIDDGYGTDLGQWSVRRSIQAPDLLVESGSITFSPASLIVGGSFSLNFRIRNNGPGAAVATTARLRMSTDIVLTRYDSPLSPLDVNIPALPAGASYTFNQAVQVPSTTPQGQYYVGVFADAEDVAGQSDVTNDSGLSATRLNVTAIGVLPPVITSQPISVTRNTGETATFTVQAQGSNPQYRWFRYSNPIGNDTATLTLTNVSSSQAGEYWVQVSNAGGIVQSNHAVLTVNSPTLPATEPPEAGELLGTFEADLPTIVITHGWQKPSESGPYTPGTLPSWMTQMREAINNRLNAQRANILFYHWPKAYSEFWEGPFLSTHFSGQALTKRLRPYVGQGYSKPIQFIGHSHGAFVNAYAVEALGISVEQFTVLDAPISGDASAGQGDLLLGSFFARHLSRDSVKWLDNYIATQPLYTIKFGDIIGGASPNGGLKTATNHKTIHDSNGAQIVRKTYVSKHLLC